MSTIRGCYYIYLINSLNNYLKKYIAFNRIAEKSFITCIESDRLELFQR